MPCRPKYAKQKEYDGAFADGHGENPYRLADDLVKVRLDLLLGRQTANMISEPISRRDCSHDTVHKKSNLKLVNNTHSLAKYSHTHAIIVNRSSSP